MEKTLLGNLPEKVYFPGFLELQVFSVSKSPDFPKKNTSHVINESVFEVCGFGVYNALQKITLSKKCEHIVNLQVDILAKEQYFRVFLHNLIINQRYLACGAIF